MSLRSMKTRSNVLGRNTSNVEVQDISKFGIWLLLDQTEYFLPFKHFPWFKNAKLSQIYNVKFLQGVHLYWPDLDIDLEIESLRHLEAYPLIYKS